MMADVAAAELTGVQASLARVRAGYAPTPKLKVSEFADEHIIVTSGPLSGTRWQTSFAPYQRGIMDAFHEPGVETVVVKGSSQWGKTACAVNIVAFHIAHDPCPILVVLPTVTPMAEEFSRNRLEPVINATPILRDTVGRKRAKDATNTTLLKTFKGGSIAMGGANSAASLASRSVRLLVLDEVDRYPAELPGEGATLAVAMKRTQAYRRRKRIFMISSPTVEDAPIDAWHKRGDQRRYYVPCPSCGHMHPFEWKNVRWSDDDPGTARLHCPSCDHGISDAERVAILSAGTWRPEKPGRRDKSIVSFHLWEAYSPLSSLSEIVGNFLTANEKKKGGDNAEMHSWQNTTLAEAIEAEKGVGIDPDSLLLRRRAFPADFDVPAGACCLTMGVDVQDDRLELLVIGWGIGEQHWLIDRQTLPGDTSMPEPWAMLDEALDQPYRHESGQTLHVQATCIDSGGHRTTIVYDYAEKKAARRVYAIIGRDGQRPLVSSPSPKKWGRGERQVPLYTIGVDAAKALLMSRLKLTAPGPGHVHLPTADWCDAEFLAQLTSERLVTKYTRGNRVQVWKKIRTRNEGLDCYVYATGALRLLNPKLHAMAAILAGKTPPAAPPADSSGTPPDGTPGPSRPPARPTPSGRRTSQSKYLG
jgi:phage terminase large subunit GpA-like protein